MHSPPDIIVIKRYQQQQPTVNVSITHNAPKTSLPKQRKKATKITNSHFAKKIKTTPKTTQKNAQPPSYHCYQTLSTTTTTVNVPIPTQYSQNIIAKPTTTTTQHKRFFGRFRVQYPIIYLEMF